MRAVTGLELFYGHLHSRDAMQTDRLWPRPYADEIAAAGIVVDAGGRRVADEGLGGIWLANAIARLPDPLGTTVVFDQAIWDGPPGTGHVQPPNPLLVEAGGTLHRAATIAELAALAGIPAQALQETVESYNAAFESGALAALSPARSDPPCAVADPRAAVLCHPALRRDHQHHGRHRGGRRRPRA